LTPAAPWRIRLTEDLRARFVDEEPQGVLGIEAGTPTG
jgi:hypothetical protein